MRSFLIKLSLFSGIFLALSVSLHATTYYVSPTGNDASPCTSAATACKTISHAVGLATSPNDVVQAGPGVYTESISLNASGSGAGAITLRGQSGSGCPTTSFKDVNSPTGAHPASQVTLNGSVTVAGNFLNIDCLHFRGGGISVNAGSSNVQITNNEIEGNGATGGGIYFSGVGSVQSARYAKNFTISKNYIHTVSNGIYFACNNCTISDNEITALVGDEPGSDHDYMNAWGVGTTIRHNYMHGNTCNSCQGYDCHMDCVQAWNTTGDGTEVSKNITFDRNICFNHHEGVIVQDNGGNGDVSNWIVTNNVFAYPPSDDGSGHLCQAGPVHPWCWVMEDGNLGATTFANNTCVDGTEGFRNNSGSAKYVDNLYLSLGDQTSMYSNDGASITGSNNLYFAKNGQFGKGSFPQDIVDRDPKIISAGTSSSFCAGCNFNIQPGSPAIGAGVPTGVGVDLLGTPRTSGATSDIGAYQAAPGNQPAPPIHVTGVLR